MFKILSLVILGAATVSATFLESERVLQMSGLMYFPNTTTSCVLNTTGESCTATNFCCAKISRTVYNATSNTTTTTNTTTWSCLPAYQDSITFQNIWVNGISY